MPASARVPQSRRLSPTNRRAQPGGRCGAPAPRPRGSPPWSPAPKSRAAGSSSSSPGSGGRPPRRLRASTSTFSSSPAVWLSGILFLLPADHLEPRTIPVPWPTSCGAPRCVNRHAPPDAQRKSPSSATQATSGSGQGSRNEAASAAAHHPKAVLCDEERQRRRRHRVARHGLKGRSGVILAYHRRGRHARQRGATVPSTQEWTHGIASRHRIDGTCASPGAIR